MFAYRLGIFLFAICSINGLVYDEKEFAVGESKCPEVAVDPSLNMTWVSESLLNLYRLVNVKEFVSGLIVVFQFKSVDYWYMPMLSKKELYLSVKLSSSPEEFANITEDRLKNSCQLFTGINYDKSRIEWYGLERKFFEWEYSLRPKRDGIVDYFLNNGVCKRFNFYFIHW